MTKDNLMISHGKVTHPASKRDDCIECIDVQIEYFKDIRKAGGVTKFVKQLEKEVLNMGKGEHRIKKEVKKKKKVK